MYDFPSHLNHFNYSISNYDHLDYNIPRLFYQIFKSRSFHSPIFNLCSLFISLFYSKVGFVLAFIRFIAVFRCVIADSTLLYESLHFSMI